MSKHDHVVAWMPTVKQVTGQQKVKPVLCSERTELLEAALCSLLRGDQLTDEQYRFCWDVMRSRQKKPVA